MTKIVRGFVEGPTGTRIIRDAESKLDYIVDLTDWLSSNTIASVTYEVSGATVVSCAANQAPLTIPEYGEISVGRAVVVWLSGGVTGVGGFIKLHVVTSGGQENDFTFQLVTRSS